MRVYVGTFDEEEAEEVADDLRKAGIKVELRHAIDLDVEGSYYVEGKLSELKKKFGDKFKEIEEVEEHFAKAREFFHEGIKTREFEEKFLDAVMPERKKFEEIRKFLREKTKGLKSVRDAAKVFDEAAEKFGRENTEEYMLQFIDEIHYMNFIHSLLERNGIEYKGDVMKGQIADDPLVKVYVEAKGEEADEEGVRYEYVVFVRKTVDVYASMIDLLFEVKRLEEIVNKKGRYAHLLFAADLMARFLDGIEGKKDLEAFMDEMGEIKDEDGTIFVSRAAMNEIFEALEKADLIKIKKGKIVRRQRG
ncbi:MAG TPA: hypothetical protein ENL42_04925 [Thermoplasmatales archaeon]|nr:hypothetical protein [Thermoplasmatales archaeon]